MTWQGLTQWTGAVQRHHHYLQASLSAVFTMPITLLALTRARKERLTARAGLMTGVPPCLVCGLLLCRFSWREMTVSQLPHVDVFTLLHNTRLCSACHHCAGPTMPAPGGECLPEWWPSPNSFPGGGAGVTRREGVWIGERTRDCWAYCHLRCHELARKMVRLYEVSKDPASRSQ